jgi:dTDP-glucose 4,6-dehydratase
MAALVRGNPGETYNIGGDVEISNIDLVKKICKAYDKIKAHYREYQLFHVNSEKLIKFVQDRKGHDFRYSVNSDKIKKQLKWRPTTNFNDGLAKTVEYYANRLIIPNTPL